MKNLKIKEQLLNLYYIAEQDCDEFTFFKINKYYTGILEYIEKLEKEIDDIKSIIEVKEELYD